MPRTIDLAHRDRLLDAVARDLVRGGLPGATLERLAVAAGTSARMLVHHFGSRRALLEQALTRARAWQLTSARAALPTTADFLDRLAGSWAWFEDAETLALFRLSTQVAIGASDSRVRSAQAREWLDLLYTGLRAAGCAQDLAGPLATALAAQFRGLFLDLDATGDRERIRLAYAESMAAIVARARSEL